MSELCYTGEENPEFSQYEVAEVFGEQTTHMDSLLGTLDGFNKVVGRLYGLLIYLSDTPESTHYCARQYSLNQKQKLWLAFDEYLRTCSVVKSRSKAKTPSEQDFVNVAAEAYQTCIPGTHLLFW